MSLTKYPNKGYIYPKIEITDKNLCTKVSFIQGVLCTHTKVHYVKDSDSARVFQCMALPDT